MLLAFPPRLPQSQHPLFHPRHSLENALGKHHGISLVPSQKKEAPTSDFARALYYICISIMFRDKPFDTLSLSPTHLYRTDKHTSIRNKKKRTSNLHKPTRRLENSAVLAEFSKRRAKNCPTPLCFMTAKANSSACFIRCFKNCKESSLKFADTLWWLFARLSLYFHNIGGGSEKLIQIR